MLIRLAYDKVKNNAARFETISYLSIIHLLNEVSSFKSFNSLRFCCLLSKKLPNFLLLVLELSRKFEIILYLCLLFKIDFKFLMLFVNIYLCLLVLFICGFNEFCYFIHLNQYDVNSIALDCFISFEVSVL